MLLAIQPSNYTPYAVKVVLYKDFQPWNHRYCKQIRLLVATLALLLKATDCIDNWSLSREERMKYNWVGVLGVTVYLAHPLTVQAADYYADPYYQRDPDGPEYAAQTMSYTHEAKEEAEKESAEALSETVNTAILDAFDKVADEVADQPVGDSSEPTDRKVEVEFDRDARFYVIDA